MERGWPLAGRGELTREQRRLRARVVVTANAACPKMGGWPRDSMIDQGGRTARVCAICGVPGEAAHPEAQVHELVYQPPLLFFYYTPVLCVRMQAL